MATGQSPDADAARKSRLVAGAGARLYMASTVTTALTCRHYSQRWGLESNALF